MNKRFFALFALTAFLLSACGTTAVSAPAKNRSLPLPETTAPPQETVLTNMDLLTPVPIQTETVPAPETTAPPPPPPAPAFPAYDAQTDRILLEQEEAWMQAVRDAGFRSCIAWYEELDMGDDRLEWVVQDQQSKEVLLFKIDGEQVVPVTAERPAAAEIPSAPLPDDPLMPNYVQYYLWDPQAWCWRTDLAEIALTASENAEDGSAVLGIFPRCICLRESPAEDGQERAWAAPQSALMYCRLDENGLSSLSAAADGTVQTLAECRAVYEFYISASMLYKAQHGIIELDIYCAGTEEQKEELLAQNRESFVPVNADAERPDDPVTRALCGGAADTETADT